MSDFTITPLAFESLGVRSMCTLVETSDVTILLDAGVSLGPRFGLMPHPIEYQRLYKLREEIEKAASRSDIVTVSHYHNDHHTPNYIETAWLATSPGRSDKLYDGKIVLAKDFRRNINTAQRRRGWMFAQTMRKKAIRIEAADNQTFKFQKTTVRFPHPVPHGESGSELGWVLPCVIERGKKKMVFAPDVQGPVVEQTLQFILDEKPSVVIVGGPPTYLQNYRLNEAFFQTALRNMMKIVAEIRTVIVDHHLLRDHDWHKFLEPVRALAKQNRHQFMTAAELLGKEPEPLEYQRKQLYEDNPPSQEFMKWSELPKQKQAETEPPIPMIIS